MPYSIENKDYLIGNKDYLELWKYFQDRADNIKEAMFNTLTWTIGFAAALLGFIFVKLTDFDPEKAIIDLSSVVILSAISGLSICLYSWFALNESRIHIKGNWAQADRCKKHIINLDEIIYGKSKKQITIIAIWNRLLIIVLFFASAFILVLGWALYECPNSL